MLGPRPSLPLNFFLINFVSLEKKQCNKIKQDCHVWFHYASVGNDTNTLVAISPPARCRGKGFGSLLVGEDERMRWMFLSSRAQWCWPVNFMRRLVFPESSTSSPLRRTGLRCYSSVTYRWSRFAPLLCFFPSTTGV